MQQKKNIPLLDCPVDYLIGDGSGKIMNEYGRFPCKIMCGVYAFMVRGTASATINITKYEFRENDVLLLEPGSFLLIHQFSEDALVYYILFSSSFLEKNTFNSRMSLSSLQLHSPVIHLSNDRAEIIKDFASLMFKATNTEPSMLNSEKMVHVFNLLQTAYSNYAQSQDEYIIKPIDRKMEIYQDYLESRSIQELRKTGNKYSVNYCGKTLVNAPFEVRLKVAGRMLAEHLSGRKPSLAKALFLQPDDLKFLV